MFTQKGSMSTEGETLKVSVLPYRCSICWLLRAPGKSFSHTLDSLGRWPRPASSFRSAQAATLLEFHVPLTNRFVRRWFCAVHGPKPPLHRHNWLSFGKFQFLIHCARHFSSRLSPSGGTCKYAKAPSTKKIWEILYLFICSFLSCLSWLLRSRVRKFRRDLWITLYMMHGHTYIKFTCRYFPLAGCFWLYSEVWAWEDHTHHRVMLLWAFGNSATFFRSWCYLLRSKRKGPKIMKSRYDCSY